MATPVGKNRVKSKGATVADWVISSNRKYPLTEGKTDLTHGCKIMTDPDGFKSPNELAVILRR